MNELNEQAIQVLKQIHERGLKVLWSYGTPYPEYDDEKQMSPDDWKIVNTVLGADVEKSEWVQTSREEKIVRNLRRNGNRIEQKSRVSPDGEEFVYREEILHLEDGPDESLFEDRQIEIDGETLQWYAWESDYLTIHAIRRDEYTETHIGLLKEYRLTEKALAIIGELK